MFPSLIGLEEHFSGKAIAERPSATAIPNHMFPKSVVERLNDLGDVRIQNMDEGSMSIQVTSHIPAVEPLDICRAVNDQLFEAIQNSHGRLRGFAFLPMAEPQNIPGELSRCVRELDFVGALIPNHAHGRFYDGEEYWPMFAKAEELDVPIYIHPTPTDDMKRYAGNYSPLVQTLIAGPAFSWHAEIGTHVLRLYGSGLFDAYPRLKIILGHNGEILPFMRDRVDKFFERRWGGHKRAWLTVWDENVWITTSGMFHLGPLRCCLEMCKADRVLYSE